MSQKPSTAGSSGLTVAVTGPTGGIGRALVTSLERSREVRAVRGMARGPFDPTAHGWRKTTYVQGDVTDERAVRRLVDGADVVVHLAFVIMAGSDDSRTINVDGSRSVFHAAVAAGAERIVHASSVAAYGFPEIEGLLGEATPLQGNDRHPYSADKAAVEAVLEEVTAGSGTDAYAVRPCIVGGPGARELLGLVPWLRMRGMVPDRVLSALGVVPGLRPVLPDPGVPFQMVHHNDVALAMRACVLGRGAPGAYNLAGEGELRVRDVADELGYRTVPVPELAVDALAEVTARFPFMPPEVAWLEAARRPMLVDSRKARRELQWRPRHDARGTLAATVSAARADQGARD